MKSNRQVGKMMCPHHERRLLQEQSLYVIGIDAHPNLHNELIIKDRKMKIDELNPVS